MIQNFIPWIGACAAVLTSLSYIPQVQKAWPRGSTHDLSLKMLAVLTAGLLLWIGYGLLKVTGSSSPPTASVRHFRRAYWRSRFETCERAELVRNVGSATQTNFRACKSQRGNPSDVKML